MYAYGFRLPWISLIIRLVTRYLWCLSDWLQHWREGLWSRRSAIYRHTVIQTAATCALYPYKSISRSRVVYNRHQGLPNWETVLLRIESYSFAPTCSTQSGPVEWLRIVRAINLVSDRQRAFIVLSRRRFNSGSIIVLLRELMQVHEAVPLAKATGSIAESSSNKGAGRWDRLRVWIKPLVWRILRYCLRIEELRVVVAQHGRESRPEPIAAW